MGLEFDRLISGAPSLKWPADDRSTEAERKKIVRRLWAPPKWRDTLVISVIGGMSLIFIVSLAIDRWQGAEIQR